MERRVNLAFRVSFRFQLYTENADNLKTLEFIGVGKALKEAMEAMMDGSDTVHDYVQEELPSDVDLSSIEIGEVVLSNISGAKDGK